LTNSAEHFSGQIAYFAFQPGDSERANALHIGDAGLVQEWQLRQRHFVFTAAILRR